MAKQADLVPGHGHEAGGSAHQRRHRWAGEQLRAACLAGRPPQDVHQLHQGRRACVRIPAGWLTQHLHIILS